jgi:hypothetical protein
MAITATVPSSASVGAFSSEIATANAAKGDYDPALANAFRTFAAQVGADLTAMDTELTGIPAPTAAAKILYDNGTAYVETAAGTAAQVPVINAGATAPVFVTISGDATITSAGVATVAKVNGATYPAGGALTTGTIPRVTGAAAVAYGALDLANASAVTGILPAANIPFQVAQITLVAGTLTLAAGITITAASRVIPVLVTPGAGASGTRYAVSGLTVGGPGTGAFTVTAKDSGAGNNTVNTDVSVLDCIIIG